MITTEFEIERLSKSRIKDVDFEKLGFGKYFSDHMFVADFIDGEWSNGKIVPFGKLSLSPSTSAIHHGQAIFEGMKAYRNDDGEVLLFRPHDNFMRMNRSAERMCMPSIPEEIFMNGLMELIKVDADWVPDKEGHSLYIRPIYFATDEAIGVKPSENYKLIIFTSPSGIYFTEPLKVLVETNYSRSSEGGVGYAKAAGNYGGAMYPTKLAQQKGYNQVIWTDASEHQYVEESGAMNLMFVIDGKIVTPALSNSKLAGITRASIITLAKDWGIPVEERNVSIQEIEAASDKGVLQDAFGCGTAANIAPIALIGLNGKDLVLPPLNQRTISQRIAKGLTDIKTGKVSDTHNWTIKI